MSRDLFFGRVLRTLESGPLGVPQEAPREEDAGDDHALDLLSVLLGDASSFDRDPGLAGVCAGDLVSLASAMASALEGARATGEDVGARGGRLLDAARDVLEWAWEQGSYEDAVELPWYRGEPDASDATRAAVIRLLEPTLGDYPAYVASRPTLEWLRVEGHWPVDPMRPTGERL